MALAFLRSDMCFLLHQGRQNITALESSSASLVFEDVFVKDDDYGSYRFRDGFGLIFCVMADGVEHEPLILKSIDKFGGYAT